MANHLFDFEAEFSLLDIGATSSLLRAGAVRPTAMAFTASGGVEAVSLAWSDESERRRAMEESRRFVRDLDPEACAVIAIVSSTGSEVALHQPDDPAHGRGSESLALAMRSRDGAARAVTYPLNRSGGHVALGMPAVSSAEPAESWPAWEFLGDVWRNPFCEGDTVRFRAGERAVDPSSELWKAIVDLTRLRIREDQAQAEEYMAFLDDLRNGIFLVSSRSESHPDRVLLAPRTRFNPLGVLSAPADALLLVSSDAADVEEVPAS